MFYSDFNFYYDKVVKNLYDELTKIDEDKFEGKVLKIKNREKIIHHFYESYRKDMRKLYMSDETNPIDRHKKAACMMCAILKVRPIKINRHIPNLPLCLLLANEFVAFYTAINIIELYKRDSGYENYLIDFPETYIKDEEDSLYINNVCKALFYTKHFNKGDIFSYANILFLLEKRTDEKLKIITK